VKLKCRCLVLDDLPPKINWGDQATGRPSGPSGWGIKRPIGLQEKKEKGGAGGRESWRGERAKWLGLGGKSGKLQWVGELQMRSTVPKKGGVNHK